MSDTRKSLLLRAQTGEENAWKDLTDLYRPLIIGWLRRQGVAARDLDDLSQEILLSVVKYLPSFEHSGRPGAFRSWANAFLAYRRSGGLLAESNIVDGELCISGPETAVW
jgi:DNA-directed RNA polymerase specialized sigma24 family protein